MTKNELLYILNDLVGYNFSASKTNYPTPLEGVKFFNENRFVEPERNRYQFDFNSSCMKIYYCKPLKIKEAEVPSNWVKYKQYDVYDNVVYKYLFNPADGEPIVDYVDFDSIDVIGLDDKTGGKN